MHRTYAIQYGNGEGVDGECSVTVRTEGGLDAFQYIRCKYPLYYTIFKTFGVGKKVWWLGRYVDRKRKERTGGMIMGIIAKQKKRKSS